MVDDSTSMRGASLQAARQAVLAVAAFLNEQVRITGDRTQCSVWTFADEPILLGDNVAPDEMSDIPLAGVGASMLPRALREARCATERTMARMQLESRDRRNLQIFVCSVIVGHLDEEEDSLVEAEALARVGRVSIIGTRPERPIHLSPRASAIVQASVMASDLSEANLHQMLSR